MTGKYTVYCLRVDLIDSCMHAIYVFQKLQSTVYAIMKGGRFETFQKRGRMKKMESSSSFSWPVPIIITISKRQIQMIC